MVFNPRNAAWRHQHSPDISARREHHGVARAAYLDSRYRPCRAAEHNWRNEAGVGLRMALAYGCGNLRHDTYGLRARAAPPLRQRANENGPSNRHYVRGNCYWPIDRQGNIFAD